MCLESPKNNSMYSLFQTVGRVSNFGSRTCWWVQWHWQARELISVDKVKMVELLNIPCISGSPTWSWLTVKLEVNVMIPVEAECDKTYTATVQHLWDNSALSEALLLLSSECRRGLSCSSPIWNWQYWMPVSWQCLEAAYWHSGVISPFYDNYSSQCVSHCMSLLTCL